jgi:hypothetical protein
MFYYDYDMPCVKNIIYKMEWMSDCCLAPKKENIRKIGIFYTYIITLLSRHFWRQMFLTHDACVKCGRSLVLSLGGVKPKTYTIGICCVST